mgnify:CR=1 FL=1
MSTFVKAAVLGLGLMAGGAFAAHAQTSDTLSSLPHGGASTEGPSAVAPSGAYPGPNAGATTAPTGRTYAVISPSGNYPGPGAGAANGPMPPHFDEPAGFGQDAAMHPYKRGIGPRPN